LAGHRTNADKVNRADRREEVFTLYKRGMSYRQIAKHIGERKVDPIKVSHITIKNDVEAVLDELHKETIGMADRYRAREDARLHDILRVFNSILYDQTADRDERLIAAEKSIKVSEQLRKLWGLDMPAKVDVTSGGERVKTYIGWNPDLWDSNPDPDEGDSE
jgi:transposase